MKVEQPGGRGACGDPFANKRTVYVNKNANKNEDNEEVEQEDQ